MKKNWIGKLTATTLSLIALTGCGGDSNNTANSNSEDTNSNSEKVELTYLTYYGNRDSDGNLVVQNLADAYMEENPNVTINIDLQAENSSTDFLTKLDLLQLSGETGDIIQIPSYREYSARASQGFFTDISSQFEDEGGYDSLYSYAADVDGQYYGVPFEPSVYLTLINKDMLDAADLSLPEEGWTWEDYADYAEKMTSGSGSDQVYGSYMHTWSEFRREGLFNSIMDNPFVNEDGSSNLDNPQFGEWLEYMKELEEEGSQISYADAKATDLSYRDVFLKGQTAMTVIGSWMFQDILNTETYPHDFQTVFAPFPVFEDGEAGVTQGSVSYITVGANSEHPKEAYDFARYISDSGAVEQNIFPATKDGDISSVLKSMVGDRTDLLDIDSALAIWENPNLVPNMITRDSEKFVEIDKIFDTETQNYLLSGQDLETTLNNIKDQAEPIINN